VEKVCTKPQLERLSARLGDMPGALAAAAPTPSGRRSSAVIYKVMGKIFAIVDRSKVEAVILKCDPDLVDQLKQTFAGVGHRSHLDRRFWISITLDADVPTDEILRLADHSYALVCSTLSRKQQAALLALKT
jgi:predicted DNA-binding protein (MmcQ/YjbR family)